MASEAATILRFHAEPTAGNCELELPNLSPVCLKIIRELEEDANILMKNANKKIYRCVCDFVRGQEFPSTAASLGIPTSLILAGVNMQDHGAAFSELGSELTDTTNCALAFLQPSSCRTLDLCLESLFHQLYASNLKLRAAASGSCCMPMLKSWFKDSRHETLVVFIQQIESFPPQVLADFIAVCFKNSRSCDKDGIPFIFLMAVSTSQQSLHKLLPFSSSNNIQVKGTVRAHHLESLMPLHVIRSAYSPRCRC